MCTKILRNFGAINCGTNCIKTETKRSGTRKSQQYNWHKSTHSISKISDPKIIWNRQLLKQQQQLTRHFTGWRRQIDINQQRRKVIPKLVYLHNPWKFAITKLNLWKLKWFWDYDFNETEFAEGAKQAAIVMTNIIRQQLADKICEFTTPVGFQQITRDMLLSRNDGRLKLIRFEKEHIRRAIPMKVAMRQNFGRKYAFIDMLFVGLRNTKDFDTPSEAVEINDIIRKIDNELKTRINMGSVPHRIVFAEIFIRFRRDYTDNGIQLMQSPSQQHPIRGQPIAPLKQKPAISPHPDNNTWAVSFYKILTFDILNYDPNPGRMR